MDNKVKCVCKKCGKVFEENSGLLEVIYPELRWVDYSVVHVPRCKWCIDYLFKDIKEQAMNCRYCINYYNYVWGVRCRYCGLFQATITNIWYAQKCPNFILCIEALHEEIEKVAI